MREAALQKRRKAAEELLRWHRKLLEEERKIGELEAAATSVVGRPQEERRDRHKFSGRQLNQLWKNMTGCEERRFVEEKHYVMSQIALERLCRSARQYSSRGSRKAKGSEQQSDGRSARSDDVNYSSVFEAESVQEIINSQEEKTKISSISELIDNFSRIEDEISILSRKSGDIASLKEEDTPSQAMTPTHVEEVPTEVEETSEESEKTVPDEIEEPTSIIEVIEDASTPHEEPTTVRSAEDLRSAQEFTEIATETQEEEKSIPEAVSSPESTTGTQDQEISSNRATSVPEASISPETHRSPTEDLKTVSREDDRISVDTEGARSSIVITEAPTEHGSVTGLDEESSVKSLDESASGDEDRQKSIPTVEDPEETSEEIRSKSDEEDQTSEVVLTESKTEPIVESPSRDMDIGKELSSLDEALESASKIEESLSKLNEKLASDRTISEEVSSTRQVESIEEESPSKSDSSVCEQTDSGDKTPSKKPTGQIDVKKRVSEILADVSPSRGDKSPRLQDLYITAYDVGATNPPEVNESTGEDGRQLPTDIFGIEAEELWRKQLAIEQEIKQIELQQKEQIPFVFMREIPNKPPPPYTPPSSHPSLPRSILPTDVKELSEVASYSSKVLYKAYQNRNLDKVKFSEQGFKLFSTVEVTRICAEYVFHICRDLARDHYRQFETVEEPSWLVLPKRPQLTRTKPSDALGLERILVQKLKELFGFKKVQVAESAIVKWGRKKRDHVDEVLVTESQEEESQWINFDKDELIVKNQLTDDVMKMLLEETATVFTKILAKRRNLAQVDV